MHKSALYFWSLSIILLISCETTEKEETTVKQPNILLIVADDLGYADLGCFGSDIETPNIDALANNGVRFTSFHTAVMCAPTRAMLLSGNDNHIAGVGAQSRRTDEFGYEGVLTNRIVPIPELLKSVGYHTYMAGKWHLGTAPENNPIQQGFEHSFVVVSGAGNHYLNQSALTDSLSVYTEDGEHARWNDGDYSTDFYTDKIIEYIDQDKNDDQPFFAFAAYTSPHWPLQVDSKYWEKYIGRYDEGYDVLKAKRLESLKKAGIIPKDAKLPENVNTFKPWDSLSEEKQKHEARKMELYAGMVDNLDYNVGRLVTYLKESGLYENTLVVFMSDNGAAAEDFYHDDSFMEALRPFYNVDYHKMGDPDSYISYGPQWAEAGSAPFKYHKTYATQGGMNAPMIISGAHVERHNEIHNGFLTLMDLAPTFYDIAGVTYPKTYNDNTLYPLKGTSLIPFITESSNNIHSNDYVFAHEHYGDAMVRKGNWKITNHKTPFDANNFELFDLSTDLAEQNDLKDEYPEKYAELLTEWERYVKESQVQFPTPGELQ